MFIRKLLILVVVAGAVMALAGCQAMIADLEHDKRVLRGEAEAGETIWGNSNKSESVSGKPVAGEATTNESTADEHVPDNFTTMEYTPSEFDTLHIKANANVKLHLADAPKIVVAAPQELHDKVELWSDGDKLEIRMTGNPQNYTQFSVDVYCPPLSEVGAAENSTLEFSDNVTQDDFTVGQLENGKITGSIDCDTLRLDMVGYGTMLLTGSAKAVSIDMVGDGTVDVQNLSADKTNVNVVGKGEILTWTNDDLYVLGVGFGTVRYRGTPSVHSLDMGPVRVIKLPDADTSSDNSNIPDTTNNSYSAKPVSKAIDSALELTHTAFDSAMELTHTVFDGALALTNTVLGNPQ